MSDTVGYSISQRVKAIAGKAENLLSSSFLKQDQLLVLNYHSTPKKFIDSFVRQVDFLQENCSVVNPHEIDSIPVPGSGTQVLFTFDDGLKNNEYALEELEKRGIGAMLFVVPEFIEASTPREYYHEAIRPITDDRIDSEIEDFIPLSWEELKSLIQKGHAIGSHTLTHKLIASFGKNETSREIVDSRSVIGQKLASDVPWFCSPNDTAFSVSPEGARLIKQHYDFHFTTVPRTNDSGFNPHCIGRRNVECFWPFGQFLNAIGSWDQFRWRVRIDVVSRLFE